MSALLNLSKSVTQGFKPGCLMIAATALSSLKALRPNVKKSKKYEQIVASVRAIGLVEPPVVYPDFDRPGFYFILDGHLRIEAAKDLHIDEIECLISTDDETYTYNKRINRLSAVQDHKMIVRAVEHGVPEERIAEALGISISTIRRRFRLLNGICEEAAVRLADKPCPMKIFEILKQMKPLRQMEAAELMIGQKNFSPVFATAILEATPLNQRTEFAKPKLTNSGSAEQMARMERELAVLQTQIKSAEDTYGPDVLHLTVMKNYLTTLLQNAAIVRWLAKNFPDYLNEFQKITELTRLPG